MEIKTEMKRTPREPAVPQMGICDKCKTEALLKKFRFKETSISDGAASFGTVSSVSAKIALPSQRLRKRLTFLPCLARKSGI